MDILYEMNVRYCENFGWHLKPGEPFNCHKTFLPYFCMDAALQEWIRFKRNHKTPKLRFETRKMANDISEAFREYSAKYRAIFTPGQVDFLLELTDIFEEFITHHLVVAEVAYMNAVSHFMDFKVQQDSGSLWLVNMIAAAGQGWYAVINPKNCMGGNRMDQHLGAVLVKTRELSNALYGTEHNFVTEESANKMNDAIQALINVVERWVARLSEEHQAELEMEFHQEERLQALLDKYRKEE